MPAYMQIEKAQQACRHSLETFGRSVSANFYLLPLAGRDVPQISQFQRHFNPPSHFRGVAGIHHCPERCQQFHQSKNKIRNNICQTEKLRDENAVTEELKASRKMTLERFQDIQEKYYLKHKHQKFQAFYSDPLALLLSSQFLRS